MKISIDIEIINEIMDEIKKCVETIDGEWGSARSFEEILKEAKPIIPDVYFKLLDAIKDNKCGE